MKAIMPGQLRMIHALLPEEVKADPEIKEEWVFGYTKDLNRLSTKQLSKEEAAKAIKDLANIQIPSAEEQRMDRMRKKIFSLMVHQMGYTKEQMLRWVVEYSPYKKPLNDHSYTELVKLVSQAEIVYNKHLKALKA